VTIGARAITRCDGLPGDWPIAAAAWDGGLAVGFRDGAARWDGAAWQRIGGLPAGPVRSLAVAHGRLWIGTGTAGLWSVAAGEARPVRADRALPRRGITALGVAADGALRVGLDPTGDWRIGGDGRVRAVARAALVGCYAGAPLAARAPGRGCALGADEAGLPSAHVTALARFRGVAVVGTFDGGAFTLAGETPTAIPGAPRLVNVLLAEEDALWIGSATGLYRWTGEGEAREVELGAPSRHVNALARGRDGTLWIATGGGLVGWSTRGVRLIDPRAGLPSRLVYAVAEAGDAALWVATAAGVVRIAADGVARFSHASGALPQDWVTSLVPDGADGVLAGTYAAGVVRLAPDGAAPLAALGPRWVNPAGLARDGERLYVATLGEDLWVVDGQGARRIATLPSDDVTATLVDGGRLLVGTRVGLAILPRLTSW
jgi:hypothetical protein